jgi:hypothetical protein
MNSTNHGSILTTIFSCLDITEGTLKTRLRKAVLMNEDDEEADRYMVDMMLRYN